MMYRAALLTYDFNNEAPTAKELKAYLGSSVKLLYGNDQRKSKNTPYADKLHIVSDSFSTFRHLFYKDDDSFRREMLYIFDDRINSTHFFLKYASQGLCHFKIDEQIIDEMHKTSWDYEHLKRYLKHMEISVGSLGFFIERGIGDNKFHKSFPSYINSTQKFKVKIEDEIKKLETKAAQLFKSGWS